MTTDDAPEEGSAAGEMVALPVRQSDRDWLAMQQEIQLRIMAVFACEVIDNGDGTYAHVFTAKRKGTE